MCMSLMLIILNGSVKKELSFLELARFVVIIRLRMECPCVCLFVMHFAGKETADETSELVPVCQRAKEEFKDG